MTTAVREPIAATLPANIAATVADRAAAVDRGEESASYGLPLLASQALFAPEATSGGVSGLLLQVRLVRELASLDLSVAFSAWAHWMTIHYLTQSGTEHAKALLPQLYKGHRPGVTGMAAAFKEAAGCGEIALKATEIDGGYRIDGSLAWASNLQDTSVIVSAAKTTDGKRLLFVVDGDAAGVTLGAPFGLLGLNATSSSWLKLEGVEIGNAQVLSEDFEGFIRAVRPTFVLLQTSECLGLAQASADAASQRLAGVNAVFAPRVEALKQTIDDLVERQERLVAAAQQAAAKPVDLLELRLAAAEAAVDAANLEVRVAGGAGYAQRSPASRRFREAAFIPVQSPSEAQLRWELARVRG